MYRLLTLGLLICSGLPLCSAAQQQAPPTPASKVPSYNLVLSPSVTSPPQAPSPKYLIAVCTFKSTEPQCNPVDQAKPKKAAKADGGNRPQSTANKPQKITFHLPDFPVYVGEPITVTAESDSGLNVTLALKSGSAKVSGTTVYITGTDSVVLTATQKGDDIYQAASSDSSPITATLDHDYCVPGLISPPDESKSADKPKSPDVNALAAALGNPRPFSAQAAGSQILIYSSRFPLTASDTANLSAIERSISNLAQLSGLSAPPGSPASGAPASSTAGSEGSSGASSPASAYTLEVPVPHASSFSSLASTLNGINPDIFSVQAIGSDRIRIKSTKNPSCRQVTQFLQDVRHIAWQMWPESPVAQEYHLAKVEDFVSAFSGKGGTTGGDASQSANQGGGGNANPGQSASNQGQPGGSNATKSGQGSSQDGSDGASGGQGDAGGTASSSSSAPGAKAAIASSSKGSGDTGTTTGSASQTPGLQSKPSGSSGPSTQSTLASVHLITPDLFLFLDQSPGNDGDISEKKRILAQVDLPRPEVLLNVWSMQLSTTEPNDVSRFNTDLKRVVSDYNNGLQEVINQSFFYLTEQMTDQPYFAPDFYRYLVGRYVWDLGTSGLGVAAPHPNLPNATLRPDQIATQMLRMDFGHPLDPTLREERGICQRNEYCLGYTTIFQPLEPSLTHLLLAVIAAQHPWLEACYAIDFVEGSDHADQERPNCDILTKPGALTSAAGQDLRQEDCESNDKGWYKNEENASNKRPPVQLECLRQTIWMLLADDSRGGQATGVGLVRAAVADFLFNYKMAQQYPHEFTAYELTLSAQKLDTALNPFDLAFNRDVIAYQENLRERIDDCGRRNSCTLGKDWVGFENKTFTNDAILTVRTLSANPTTVSVTTQNFLSDTQPAALSDLLASSVKEGGGSGGGSSKAAVAMVGGLLQTAPLPAQLALNVLKASKSTEIQIGKSIKLNVTPHALSSASAAELDLTLNVDDAAEPTFYTPTQSSQKADVSRVSNQDVTTRVRVDSLKLVNISSFSATLRCSRSRFPLLPVPGVEVPYVGSLLGIPLPAAKEYHSSTAVLSAIVVPTAADLAYGLVFVSDRIVDPEHAETCRWPGEGFDEQHRNICKIRKAESLSDLGNAPLRNFNKARVACLATGGQVPYLGDPETLDSIEPSFIVNSCTNLTFDTMFWDAY